MPKRTLAALRALFMLAVSLGSVVSSANLAPVASPGLSPDGSAGPSGGRVGHRPGPSARHPAPGTILFNHNGKIILWSHEKGKNLGGRVAGIGRKSGGIAPACCCSTPIICVIVR